LANSPAQWAQGGAGVTGWAADVNTRAETTQSRIRSFERNGLVFDVTDAGPINGQPVVLLHGFPAAADSWNAVADGLHRAGYRTLAPDQRGYSPGARPADVQEYAIGQLVLDVLTLADTARMRRFHVVGHDWGGAVAWHLAAAQAMRVQTLTVLSTPHPRAFAESLACSTQLLRSWYTLAWQVPRLPEWVMTAGGGALLRVVLARSGLPQPVARTYADRMLEPGALTAALNWYRAALHPRGAIVDVADVAVPTLYIWSNRDPSIGRTAAELTRRHVNSAYRFDVLDNVSHWIPETAADSVVDAFVRCATGRRRR
jgi:pimeloyl-ACP methyl ester carboxylesterase